MKEFWEKRKTMSMKQWLVYLWEYYAAQTAVILLVSAFTIYIIVHMFSGKELIFSGIFVNCAVDSECKNYLTTDFFEKSGGNPRKEDMDLTMDVFISEGAENISQSRMLLEARTMAREIDYMIVDEEAMEMYRSKDALADLKECISEETLTALEDRLITLSFESKEFGDTYTGAISLEKSDFAEKYHLKPEKAYLVFLVNGKNLDRADAFVKYLFEE